ncbi:MAG: CheR family methyltransferase [Gammaproteobacteria bacterium]
MSPERLRRLFNKEDSHYRVSKALREMVVFARQNVGSDPPFSHMDLISCRNLLIYLAPPLQKRVIPTFHYALNPAGFRWGIRRRWARSPICSASWISSTAST